MLMVNQLTGFGGAELAPRYRHMRVTFGAITTPPFNISDFHALVDGAEYPIQSMTDNSTPSPLVASASSDAGNVWKAFSRGAGTWEAGTFSTAYLALDFGAVALPEPTAFTITVGISSPATPPASVTIAVSVDGSSWTTLVAASGFTWQPAGTPTLFPV